MIMNTGRKVSLQVFYLDDDILHCLLWVLSFYAHTPTVCCPAFIPKNPNFFFLLSFSSPQSGHGGDGGGAEGEAQQWDTQGGSLHLLIQMSSLVWQLFHSRYICWCRPSWARICKRLRSPESDSKESIPPAYVAWLAGLPYRHARLGIDSWAP